MKEGVSVALANEALRVETMANTTFLVAKFAVEVAQFPTAEKLLVACIIVDEAIRGKQVRFPCCFHAVFKPFLCCFRAKSDDEFDSLRSSLAISCCWRPCTFATVSCLRTDLKAS